MTTDRETAMLLGKLVAQVENLTKAVEILTEKGEERGARTYRELEQLRIEIADLKRVTQAHDARLGSAEPMIKLVEIWKQRLIVIVPMLGLLIGVVAYIIELAINWAIAKFAP